MPSSKKLLIILSLSLAFALAACQKEEEKPPPPPKKAETPLPAVTQERIDLWVKISEDLGRFIRKFSLEKENITEKRELMILVHGSPRIQGAYGRLFESAGMDTREFWNVLDVMKKCKKYLEIKAEEKVQNANIDDFIAAGRSEVDLLKKKLSAEESSFEREKMEETIVSMEKKMAEFDSMKGKLTPASVGIGDDMLTLWHANREKFEKALDRMWKIGDPSAKKEPFKHF